MVYIKKLVMKGFKSFVRKTEIPLTPNINVILGPNGSGKSNISDALCFVLGRLNTKSIRASNAGNLIFLGNKSVSASKEAFVEIILDNSDKTFSMDKNEISIKRLVRRNGQSLYKINNETKTRQEVLSLLAQAGIDPNGFNIILQGEIQNFVRMHTIERRKIIEEVSGISIYESRKQKSLKELEKTENKLKEVSAVLRERTNYMNNLEKERQQALKYKKLEKDLKKYKASIINFDLNKKKKESEKTELEISKKNSEKDRLRKSIINIEASIKNFESRINEINSNMQKSTGLEQEKLNQDIANLRAELAGLNVKLENHQNKLSEINKQEQELNDTIRDVSSSIEELQKESPTKNKKQSDIESKKKELEKLESQRKKFYTIKSELKSIKERLEDKKSLLQNYDNESQFILKQIKSLSKDLFDRRTTSEKINTLKASLTEKNELLDELNKNEKELEKISYSNESEVDKQKQLIEKISRMDICPVCKSRITEEHVHSINSETTSKIDSLKREIENSDKKLNEISQKKKTLQQEIEQINSEIFSRESDLSILSSIDEKKEQIKNLNEKIEKTKKEITELEKRKKTLERNFDENSNIEKKYEELRLEVQDISLRSEENLNSEISFKQRELERARSSLKQLSRNKEDLNEEISEIQNNLKEKEDTLNEKRKQEEELNKKFQKLISEREDLQKKVRDLQIELSEKQNKISTIEQEINNIKIEEARLNAEVENLETELLEFGDIEPIKSNNRDSLVHKMTKTQDTLSKIGSVNLRSLEVYDSVKKEYDSIKEKVEVIEKEKEGILNIISEIDTKKKRTFMKTLNSLNETFSKNFSKLSSKGEVFLQLEDKKDPFSGGVNVVVKMGHGKYFDVTSLSGGEQTLVALSLIFAIQELKPYYFYILDEIDAALDKKNSERLSNLLKKYMEKGQYIIITHNDEVISNAANLYGVSMHEGVSKIVSLKV